MASHQNDTKTDPADDVVRKAVAMIAADAAGTLRIGEIARQLGISREHLSRLCREQLGRPLRTLMLEQRIHRACRLLKETDMPIKLVAERAGYTAYPNFLNAFKEVTGMTPHTFRQDTSPDSWIRPFPTPER